MTAMSINESSVKNIPTDMEACYEAVASQEEIYLEETEEERRVILVSDNSSSPRETPDQQRDIGAEELITGDSDDPPLSGEVVEEMLRMT
jgi:hypothetical protein